jgi:hypothetical protein
MVNVSFLVDDIAQEYNETVTLVLVPLPTTNLPKGEGVFFLNTTDMTIIDADGEYFCFNHIVDGLGAQYIQQDFIYRVENLRNY